MSHTSRTANRRRRRNLEARTPQAISRHEARLEYPSDELSQTVSRHYRRIAGECARYGYRLVAS